MTATSYLGKPTSRVDGRAKVTGAAKYAAEYNVPGLAHGVVVSSAIAKGRIKRIDAADALAVDGVLDVFTHEHRPKLASSDEKYEDEVAPSGSPFRPLYDDRIRFSGQPVALVVAEEFEIARFAASLVRVEYEQQAHVTDFEAQRERATASKRDAIHARGKPARGVRAGGGAGRGRISHAGRAPQSDGDVRGDGGLGRRRPHHRLRQDAGTAELPQLRRRRVRDAARQGARAVALSSAARSDPGCVRNMSCRSPCWRRSRSSARCG